MATLDQICQLLGVSRAAVGDLVNSGIVVKLGPGEYNGPETCRRYIAHLKQRQADTPKLTAARVKLAEEKAKIAEMERRRLEGELVSAKQVRDAWITVISVCRTRLLAIPAKVAARVKMAGTIVEVAAIIRAEIYDALRELSTAEVVVGDDPPAAA